MTHTTHLRRRWKRRSRPVRPGGWLSVDLHVQLLQQHLHKYGNTGWSKNTIRSPILGNKNDDGDWFSFASRNMTRFTHGFSFIKWKKERDTGCSIIHDSEMSRGRFFSLLFLGRNIIILPRVCPGILRSRTALRQGSLNTLTSTHRNVIFVIRNHYFVAVFYLNHFHLIRNHILQCLQFTIDS